VTEVLSGSYYEGLGTASPHQIWSSAMVLSPVVRGMLGVSVDEAHKTVRLAPHIPADWNTFSIHNLSACGGKYDIAFHRDPRGVNFSLSGNGSGCAFTISPAFSKHARILGATFNGKKLAYRAEAGEQDQHASVEVSSPGEVAIQVAEDFGIVEDADLPPLGSESVNLKIFHEQWSADNRQLTIRLAGVSGKTYELQAYGAKIASVAGGKLKQNAERQAIEIAFPAGEARYVEREIAIRF
jgi:hypothetical protein